LQTYELWQHESDYTFFPERNADARGRLPPGAVKIWSVEAASWNEACSKKNEFLGWGPYEPLDDDSE
jgi:hypothetical protein